LMKKGVRTTRYGGAEGRRAATAKCRTSCSSFWNCYNVHLLLILQMQQALHTTLETVLRTQRAGERRINRRITSAL
jgi:hypothetical protein